MLPPILSPKMSDEWRKYKVIQEQEDKVFREVLEKEVSISLSSEDVKLQLSIGIITQTHTDFLISRQHLTPSSWLVVTESFLLKWVLILLLGLDPNTSWYEVVLQLYKREVGPRPEKVCHFFSLVIACGTKSYLFNLSLWGTVQHTDTSDGFWCLKFMVHPF